MKYNSIFSTAACLFLLFACTKEENAPNRRDFVGDWHETSKLSVFTHDSLGQIVDTVDYQAAISLFDNGAYQTAGERPFGISNAGSWTYDDAETRLLFFPNPVLLGWPQDTVYWDIISVDARTLSVAQKKTLTPVNGSPLESKAYRQFNR